MASRATSTPTTPAMPITTTEEPPMRCPRVLTPTRVTDAAWRPPRVTTSQSANSTAAPSRTGQGATTQTASATTSAPIRAAFTRNDLNRFMGASSATGQCVDDVQAHGAQRGQGAHQQPDAQHQRDADGPALRPHRGQVEHAAAGGGGRGADDGRQPQADHAAD